MLNLKRCAHHFLKTFFWGFLLVFLFIGEVQGNEPRIQLTLEERAWLEAHPEIIIAYDGNYPPYSYQDKQGAFKGIAIDVANEVARRAGLKLKPYADGTWNIFFEAAKQRQVDVIPTLVRRPERDQWFSYTKPYMSYAPVHYYPQELISH